MSHFTEDLDDLQGVLLPLDGGAGPARRISRQKASELVRTALEAASVTLPSEHPVSHVRSSRGNALPRRARSRRSSR
jgi:hypothetical protein